VSDQEATSPAEPIPGEAGLSDPPEPTYPDTTVGVLMRQRDDLARSAANDRGMVAFYGQRATDTDAKIQQLQASIDALGSA
jgi:hypothetical protein